MGVIGGADYRIVEGEYIEWQVQQGEKWVTVRLPAKLKPKSHPGLVLVLLPSSV
jgi:hypothetical protein